MYVFSLASSIKDENIGEGGSKERKLRGNVDFFSTFLDFDYSLGIFVFADF